MLQKQFLKEQIAPFVYEHKAPEPPPAAFRFIQGHFGFTYAKKLDAQIITVLRDPLDRIVSLYYFLRVGNRHPLAAKLSFEEFLQSTHHSIVSQISDAQTWQLAHGSLTWQRPQLASLSEQELLAKALANLQSCFAVGVTDQLDRFALGLSSKLGLDLLPPKRKNKTGVRPAVENVPLRLRDMIQAQTRLDRQLYEAAQDLASRI